MKIQEIISLAAHKGAHHIRLVSPSGKTFAHTAVDGCWSSKLHEALYEANGLIDRQSAAGVCYWADAALSAGLQAASEMLAAAVSAGALTPEIKIGETWSFLE